MTDNETTKQPISPCYTCGHATNHDGHAAAQLSCDTASYEKYWATNWLITSTGLPEFEATHTINKLSTALGTRQSVRALEVLIGLGWRPSTPTAEEKGNEL